MFLSAKRLYSLGISAGHHHKYSTSLLNFFLLGVDIISQNIFFKMREIFYSIYSFKRAVQFILNALSSKRLDFIFVFSNFDQFAAISSMLKNIYDNIDPFKLNCVFYSIVKPQSGFLTSDKRIIAPEFIIGSLPEDVYYERTMFLSFGQDSLNVLLKELIGRVGSLSCGIVDSNQQRV